MNQSLRLRYRNLTLGIAFSLFALGVGVVGLCLCVLQRNPAEVTGFLMALTFVTVCLASCLQMAICLWRHAIEANPEGIILQGALRAKRIPWSGVEAVSWQDGVLTIRSSKETMRIKGKYYKEDEVVLVARHYF